METILKPAILTPSDPHLRLFEPVTDLDAVADLVELCFSPTLDADGHRYLRQMRNAARNPNLVRIASRMGETNAFPMSGFVWIEKSRLVGNLSLIPFSQHSRRIYLIANVAVHPDFRRKGIARALTRAALNHLQQAGADFPWLQVRDDNPLAYQLYASLGFKEHTRRTTWHIATRPAVQAAIPAGIKITSLQHAHRKDQQRWLQDAYPLEIAWHLPFRLQDLQPGLLGFIKRLFSGVFVRQWAAIRNDRLIGTIAWQANQGYYNTLWMATDPQEREAAAYALLGYVTSNYGMRRAMALDHPTGWAADALQAHGFVPHQTLVWMQAARWT